MQPRVSQEGLILAKLRDALGDVPGATFSTGMGGANRFPLAGWDLVGMQQFQFGDLRIETPTTTVVVEAESAGGVTNLAKYWPLLEAGHPRRFVLAHLFQVSSQGDYVSHIRLWAYLVERMRADLAERAGLNWPESWEARLFRYGPTIDATADVVEYIREAVR
jgi:hypothetical protein